MPVIKIAVVATGVVVGVAWLVLLDAVAAAIGVVGAADTCRCPKLVTLPGGKVSVSTIHSCEDPVQADR